MSGFSFADLQKVADSNGFKTLEPNEYEVVVHKCEYTKSQKTDKDMFKTTFKVVEGPHAGKGYVFNYFVISPESPAALGFFFRDMATMGLDETYFAKNPGMEQVADDLVGKRARVQVAVEQYQGSDRNTVKKVMKPKTNGAPSPSMNGVSNASSAPQVTSSAPSNGVPQVSTPAPQAAPQTAPPSDDVF